MAQRGKDIFAKCQDSFQEARQAMAMGYYPYFLPLSENDGTEVEYHGHRLIMAGSNNYLGLTTDPRVKEAALEATKRFGTSCTGSRFLNGSLDMHEQLEHELAEFVGKEAALVFSTGFQVNLGTISAIVGRDDYVIVDRDDHASIVDGCRLALGEMKRFKHNDARDLARVLASLPAERGKLVVVDGVFSMGGDIAPLPEYIPICQRYGARLMVKEGQKVDANAKLAEWEPFAMPLLSEVGGVVKYGDIIDQVTGGHGLVTCEMVPALLVLDGGRREGSTDLADYRY